MNKTTSGILLINKAKGTTSFSLVRILRKLTSISKIGHAGTLDPLASGVMIMLIGKEYTKKSDAFLSQDKEYKATIHLGISTDTYDREGKTLKTSSYKPTLEEVENALKDFQGEVEQVPPMFSAKKVKGQKLYTLARQGISIDRLPIQVQIQTELIKYDYPYLDLNIICSKGTYIRSLAYDLGEKLKTCGHLSSLSRLRVGPFCLSDCIEQAKLLSPDFILSEWLKKV